MSVKDRIKIYINDQKLTISAFETSILASNGYINSISKSIGLDKLEIIIEKYPTLNIIWLLTGKGSMTLSNTDYLANNDNCVRCKDKDRIIMLLEEKIEYQNAKIASLKKQLPGANSDYSQTA